MHKKIRKKTRAFIHKHHLTTTDFKSVRNAAKAEGYNIVEFNHLCNDKDVNVLVEALHLTEYVRSAKGFTYADNNYRIIFLHEDLNDTEKTVVLLHELGHIVLGHLSSNNIIGNDVVQEFEANEFSHYVANRSNLDRFYDSARWHKKWYIAGIAAILVCVILFCCFCNAPTEQPEDFDSESPVQTEKTADTPAEKVVSTEFEAEEEKEEVTETETQSEPLSDDEVYITETGKKYHRADCRYIKNKKGVTALTEKQKDSGFYEACAYCNPE